MKPVFLKHPRLDDEYFPPDPRPDEAMQPSPDEVVFFFLQPRLDDVFFYPDPRPDEQTG